MKRRLFLQHSGMARTAASRAPAAPAAAVAVGTVALVR